MNDLKTIVAKNIRFFRKERSRITQSELAQKAKVALMSVHRAESGEENLRLDTVEMIAKALEIPVIELFRDPQHKVRPTKEDAMAVIMEALGMDHKRRRGPKNVTRDDKNDTFEDPK